MNGAGLSEEARELTGAVEEKPATSRKEMTHKAAKELSLEMWRYLAEHPELSRKEDLPDALYGKIERFCSACPLCELFRGYECRGCPLCVGRRRCYSFRQPYFYWRYATDNYGWQEAVQVRRQAAADVVRQIEAWETDDEKGGNRMIEDRSAFPVFDSVNSGGYTCIDGGLTARQYASVQLRVPRSGDEEIDAMIRENRRAEFAAQAMAAIVAAESDAICFYEDKLAKKAFEFADAMLAEWEGHV
jgi:hypothetical protein